MSYRHFLLFFVVPPLLGFAWGTRRRWDKSFFRALAITLAIVYIATIPWDSAAIHWGVWSFDESRLLGVRVGPLLPLEEASFFGLQTVLVALVWNLFRRRT